ncbi:AAA family ATPase [Robertmurraya massiliosenegalensis]|uniref:AAA family ATPase n=1 Tax=Robertmurraya massiliosenegalensis TaxID=1287657 RepID=UPI00030E29F8|nr:AAA family ATPase [Robertmurraya massiliosenegalensis]
MLQIAGYKIIRLLDSTNDIDYYEGIKEHNNKRVVIVHTVSKSKLGHEHYYDSSTQPFLMEPIEMKAMEGQHFAIYEYFSFEKTLATFIREKSLTLEQILFISIQLVSLLWKMHQHKGLFGILNPAFIFVNLSDKKINVANPIGAKQNAEQQRILYSSPELTGRMEKEADFRSDLYSFGVVLYELLTGQSPFEKADLIAIVHAHFTKIPPPPTTINGKIPTQLSQITEKLLAKSPEKRYQSAFSLKTDLEKCQAEWELERNISNFPLGQGESAQIIREKRLFGRDKELQELNVIFSMVEAGNTEFVHINGNSGNGKTALVNEFIRSCDKKNVIVATGKWDQYERNIPYGPIIQAWKTIFRTILSQGEQSTLRWRNLFIEKLGHRCQILTDLIPEFSWIIGQQIFTEKIGSLERQNSILLTFQQFISVLTTEYTLLLFIDDIQWADQPTLDLLRYLANDSETTKLLILLASRDEKGQSAKSLHNLKLVQDLKRESIYINPLNKNEVSEWLSHTYQFQGDFSHLTNYVYNLSQGNPFFLEQILNTLEKENYISLNFEHNRYEFYISRFPDRLIGHNIIDHIKNKLEKLSSQARKTLKMVSCLGTNCTFNEISLIMNGSRNELLMDLYLLIDEGFICFSRQQNIENDIVLEFIHDKVQQAVYTSMTEEQKMLSHYQIGLRKWLESNKLDNPSYLHKLTDHLNLSVSLLDSRQRDALASLNAKAGQLAKNAAAFDMAYHYFLKGRDLLKTGHWEESYPLSYEIFAGLGECAYLNGDFDLAEMTFESLLKNAKTNKEKMSVHNLKLMMYTHLSKFKEAVDTGTAGLKLFGWKLDRPIGKFTILKELLLIQCLMFRKKPEDFLQLSPMKSEDNRLIMESFINMNGPSYDVNQNLATYLMLRAVRFTLKHGDTEMTALVYNNYGLILSAGFGKFDKSHQFGKLALAHVERSQVKKLEARVHFVFGSFVNHWKSSIAINLESLQKSQNLSLETGNFHLAGAASSFIIITRMIKGEPLEAVLKEINQQLAFVNKIQYFLSMKFLLEMKEWVEWLIDEQNPLPAHLDELRNEPSAFIMHNTVRLQMSYMAEDEEKASEIIDALNNKVTNSLVLVIAPEFYFYHTLWLCRFYNKRTKSEKKKIKFYLKRNLKKLEKWAKQAPVNYEHKYLLMKLESEKLLTRNIVDSNVYDYALNKAIENGFLQDAAIICECAGRYYQEQNSKRLSHFYMKEAYQIYKQWGAGRKLTLLSNQFSNLFIRKESNPELAGGLDIIDLEAVIKTSQALSGEIVLENLIEKVMEIVLKNAGATKGILWLQDGEELTIVSPPEVSNEKLKAENLPMQIIQYVESSLEPVILNQACVEGLFKEDTYIQTKKVMSLMTIPLLHQSRLLGILYIENHLLPYAFTERDLLLISTIASQAAISIQNAFLYMSLEEKVKARTEELEMVNKNLEKANEELADAERVRMELLSNISHDLRNPLTSIQGYIEAMLDGIVISPDKQMTYLKRSKEKLTGLNRLIQDLFELSKLQYGNMTFLKEIVNIKKLFYHLCDQHEWDIRQKGLKFKSSIEESEDLSQSLVDVDVGRIEQVVTNIVSNAIKHTNEGSISMSLHKEQSQVIFSIIDTGIGISAKDLERIFERSFTGQMTSSITGNGLGLSISKEIIHHHDGVIWAESTQGEGTTIFFTLPIVELEIETSEEMEAINESLSIRQL